MSHLPDLLEQARRDRLYPSVILYGATATVRRDATLELARVLLCEKNGPERGCVSAAEGVCGHCRRVAWPGPEAENFHPDLHVLERDRRTTTSIDATKAFAAQAMAAPFEARGQVFVVAEADTLGGGAADALLKLLEEPPSRSPRHFLLLTASRLDLQATLRSRSLSVFLGSPARADETEVEALLEAVSLSLDGWFRAPSALHLLTAAAALGQAEGFADPRARRPWETVAAVLLRYTERRELAAEERRPLLSLAAALLQGPGMRVRGVSAERILEGLLSQHLTRPR